MRNEGEYWESHALFRIRLGTCRGESGGALERCGDQAFERVVRGNVGGGAGRHR